MHRALAGVVAAVVALGGAAQAQAEPNETMATAYGPVTVSFSEQISTQNDIDWYFLYAMDYTQLGVGLTAYGPLESCWSIVRLMNPAGGFLEEATAFKNSSDHIRYTLPASGRYYLEVTGGGCQGLGSYRIDLAATPALLAAPPVVPPPPPPPPPIAAPSPTAPSRITPCDQARTRLATLVRKLRRAQGANYRYRLRIYVQRARAKVAQVC